MFCSTCLVCFYGISQNIRRIKSQILGSHKFSILQNFGVEERAKEHGGVKELHKSNSGKNTSIKATTYNIRDTTHQKSESA
jgi:hypothetical protein